MLTTPGSAAARQYRLAGADHRLATTLLNNASAAQDYAEHEVVPIDVLRSTRGAARRDQRGGEAQPRHAAEKPSKFQTWRPLRRTPPRDSAI
jgi:hypothetical protein